MFLKTLFAAAALAAVVASSAQAGPIMQRGAFHNAGYTPSAQSMQLRAPKLNPVARIKRGDRIRISGLEILRRR